MSLLSQFKYFSVGIMMFQLLACSSQLPKPTTKVEIAPQTSVSLPLPIELGYELNATQLIDARWQDRNKQWQQQQLPVQLQVKDHSLQLAGFSSWGTRLLTLDYSPSSLETNVSAGLGAALPQPEQVLFNLMITLWPIEAWQPRLQIIGWHIEETNLSRYIFDQNNNKIIEITYSTANKLDGDILFLHHSFNYQITIKTPDYSQKRVKIDPHESEFK